jgi:hypothetical protein
MPTPRRRAFPRPRPVGFRSRPIATSTAAADGSRGRREEPASSGFTVSTIIAAAGVFGPGALIGALLFYFGWVRTHALFSYFGIDADDINFTTQDYILRSAGAIWPALAALALLMAIGVYLNQSLTSFLAGEGRSRFIGPVRRTLVLLSVLLMIPLAVQLTRPSQDDSLLGPLCLAAGSALLARAASLRSRPDPDPGSVPARQAPDQWNLALRATLICLVVLGLFWTAAIFADELGTGRAETLAAEHFDAVPDVVLYTTHPLHVDATGVTSTDLGATYAPYRYRYAGLKLLSRGNGRILLIPYTWSTSNAFGLVLPDTSDLLITFAPSF